MLECLVVRFFMSEVNRMGVSWYIQNGIGSIL